MDEVNTCIDIVFHDNAWLSVMTEEEWLLLYNRCYQASGAKVEMQESTVSVCLTNNDEIALLNSQYRNKTGPTNVLSFPQEDTHTLGDIVLAYGIIKEEAEKQNKTFTNHVIHLFIHGLLHLLGHDHVDNQEAERMELLEIKKLAELGVANPYE